MFGKCSESAYLSDSPNVLVARRLVEAEVFIQTKSDVIAIQAIGKFMEVEEMLLKRTGDGGLYGIAVFLIAVKSSYEGQYTFPLALSPVNQMVTPFCFSNSERSSEFTEPNVTVRSSMKNPAHFHDVQHTWMKSDVCRHLTDGFKLCYNVLDWLTAPLRMIPFSPIVKGSNRRKV